MNSKTVTEGPLAAAEKVNAVMLLRAAQSARPRYGAERLALRTAAAAMGARKSVGCYLKRWGA